MQKFPDFEKKYPELAWYNGKARTVHGDGVAERQCVLAALKNLHLVKNNDYDAFTAPQKEEGRLTSKTFRDLRVYIEFYLKPQENLEYLEAAIAIHDLLKIEDVIQRFKAEYGMPEGNHDQMMSFMLKNAPQAFPTLVNMVSFGQDVVKTILGRGVNGEQFLQGECNIYNVKRLFDFKRENPRGFGLFTIFEIFDVSGALGHRVSQGSPIFTESTTRMYVRMWQHFDMAQTAGELYESFMDLRGREIGLNLYYPPENLLSLPLQRLGSAARMNTYGDAGDLVKAYDLLDYIHQVILTVELSDLYGTMLYYMPQLIMDRVENKTGKDRVQALFEAFTILAKCFIAIGKDKTKLPKGVCDLIDLVNDLKGKNTIPDVVLEGNKIVIVKEGPITPLKRSKQ